MGKYGLFFYLKVQTVAHIVRLIASAASFSWFIFHKGKKVLMQLLSLSYHTINERWAINSYPLFHSCSLCRWACQITLTALCVSSLRFLREQLVQGKCLDPLKSFPWGKAWVNALGWSYVPMCLQGWGTKGPRFSKGLQVLVQGYRVVISARLQGRHDNPPCPHSNRNNNRKWQWHGKRRRVEKGELCSTGGEVMKEQPRMRTANRKKKSLCL